MSIMEVEILIEKYFEGQTSLEEEKLLRDFFASGRFPAGMKPVAAIFGYFEIEKEVKTSSDFAEKFFDKIAEKQRIPFYQKQKFWFYFSGVAASIVFLISIYLANHNNPSKTNYTSQEAQQAYLQTRKTLAYVSEKFNSGVKTLDKIEKIEQNTQRISTLSKLNQNITLVDQNVKKLESGMSEISKLSKLNIIINQ